MNILIVGLGYVGMTTGLVLAEQGWKVTGLDVDKGKISSLRQGVLPFYEPGMDLLLTKHQKGGSIDFSSDPAEAIREHDAIFLCVGTPSAPDGSANLTYIRQAAQWIGEYGQDYKMVVVKSTVPVGTQECISSWILDSMKDPFPFDVVSNPEFLREGSALSDALHPDRIIIGSDNAKPVERLMNLYSKLDCPVFVTSPKNAEMIKYASNAFLATKISFINELARLCDKAGIQIDQIAQGIGLDPRIGGSFLKAGIGYGGSCFPKDVHALLHTAREQQIRLSIMEKVVEVNQTQYLVYLDKLEQRLTSLRGKTIAVLGLAFKPNTDDIREAPSLAIIRHLVEKQALIHVHDPAATLPEYLQSASVRQCATCEDALRGSDAVILCTEWMEYKTADWFNLRKLMRGTAFVDGRNVLDGKRLASWGYDYMGLANG
jgi:UDPglucose 6-dehydrogenase